MENQLSKIGLVKGKKKESMEETPGSCKLIFPFFYRLYILFILLFIYLAFYLSMSFILNLVKIVSIVG